MLIRDMMSEDWPMVLELNQASVENLSELDRPRLRWLASLSHRSLVLVVNGTLAGFAIALTPGTSYDSLNYRWLSGQFSRFFYLDRVVVSEGHRRRGIATQLYDAMELDARPFGRMVCDIAVEPSNDASLAFHVDRGYVEVGRQAYAGGKVVAYMCKDLGGAAR
jgi:uncharacterized protein